MNDITKARYYLQQRGSSVAHLTSFGLLLAHAENEDRDIKLRQQGNAEWDNLSSEEAESALDYAVLKYMKKHNRLPRNITDAFKQGITKEDKIALAMVWISSQ